MGSQAVGNREPCYQHRLNIDILKYIESNKHPRASLPLRTRNRDQGIGIQHGLFAPLTSSLCLATNLQSEHRPVKKKVLVFSIQYDFEILKFQYQYSILKILIHTSVSKNY